jgi:glycosyltransferase involved in cell wall biosynthesis
MSFSAAYRENTANHDPTATAIAFSSSSQSSRRSGGQPLKFRPQLSPPISATILTKDSAARLDEVLSALHWCAEVIVLDTGSTDNTIAIAESHPNVRAHRLRGPFPGFGRAHQHAVELARHDWIISIDSDEVVSPELAAEIRGRLLEPDTVYTLPFFNYLGGRHITTCGWSPDRHERLFHRGVTNFCQSEVHERVQTDHVRRQHLKNPVHHYSYSSLDDFLRKQRSYARLFADQYAGRKSSGPVKAVSRGAWAFFKSYLLQRGFTQGREGLVISAYKSQTVFWKYLLLHEANCALQR